MDPHNQMAKLRSELLTDLEGVVSRELVEHDVDPDLAEHIGCAIADRIADHWGGQILCIPMNYAYKLAKLDLQIYSDFTGNNHANLAKKYKRSVRTIYKVISRARKHKMEYLNQPDLFPDA